MAENLFGEEVFPVDLTKRQAELLVVLLGCTGGDPEKSDRKHLDSLRENLEKQLGDDNEYVLASEDDGAYTYLDFTELGVYIRNEDVTTDVTPWERSRDRDTAETIRGRIHGEFGLTEDGTAQAKEGKG